MKLKTICNNCRFFNKNQCFFNIDTFKEESHVFTEGFCLNKRDTKWRKDQQLDWDLWYVVEFENYNVDVVIDAYKLECQDIIEKIQSLNTRFFKLIVITNKKTALNDLVKFLSNSEFKWEIKSIQLEEDEFDSTYMIDFAVDCASSPWVLFVPHNESVSMEVINKFRSEVVGKDLYKYSDTSKIIAINRQAFIELYGNQGESFLNKIKAFENWNNLCTKIE